MALPKETERICRQLGNLDGLAVSLINQAVTLSRMKRHREAVTLAEAALKTADGAGLTALARQIRPMLDQLQGGRRR